MRAPAFWALSAPSLPARLLGPFAAVYGAITGARMGRVGERAAVPVVCIGNFTLGGAGKTPTALAVAETLRDMGEMPAFLSRGYGGRLPGPLRVDPAHHTAAEVGDEPLLLARHAAAFVSRDRPAGARLAADEGASVVVMDDGLQNPSLVKDLALAVVDGGAGLGNGLVFPAGPLRAPLAAQWPRVDALVLVGEGPRGEAVAHAARQGDKPVLRAHLVPDADAAASLSGARVVAFAGIGRPDKFFATLEQCGAEIVARRTFPDHHAFSADEIAALRRDAEAAGARLVTTEKDLVRLRSVPALRPYAMDVAALPVRLIFDDVTALRALLTDRLAAGRSAG